MRAALGQLHQWREVSARGAEQTAGLTGAVSRQLGQAVMALQIGIPVARVEFMDAAQIKKAHLVGESQGGQIGVLTAYEHPERVDKLGLIVGGIPSNEHGYVSGQSRLQELTRDATGTPTKETKSHD